VKTASLISLVTVVALAACSQLATRIGQAPSLKPNPHRPVVSVSYDQIVIDQEPIVIPPGNKDPIVWTIPDDEPFTFPGDKTDKPGIVFDDKSVFKCSADSAKQYTCTNSHPEAKKKYKYNIRVLNEKGKPIDFDPNVVNG
jgi:hypothetical protein